MKVKNWMTKDPVVISPEASLMDVVSLMHQKSIRHIPVVRQGQMLGFITESSLRQYLVQPYPNDIKASDVMILNPITISADSTLDAAARLIYKYKIGGLPVIEKRQLVGILTTSDIVAAFIEFMGMLEDYARIDIMVTDKQSSIEDALKIIRGCGGKIISVVMDAEASRRKVHSVRLERMELAPVIERLEQSNFKVISVLE